MEDEVNTLAAERMGETGLEHAFLLGAEQALEWAAGLSRMSPSERFDQLQKELCQ